MSETYQSLSHSTWGCKYHVVFVPKRSRRALFGQTRRQLSPIFHTLAWRKECQIIEGYFMPDPVHICIAIPPQHPVSSVIGFLRGKSTIAIGPIMRQGEKLFWGTLLGPWLRCIRRWLRVGASPEVHPRARSSGRNKRAILK
jgi:putative transposase